MRRDKYFSKNLVLFFISAFIPKILSFLLVPFYTGILSTAEYGLIDIITTTTSLCLPIFTMNMAEGVMRFTIDNKKDTRYIRFGLFVTSVGCVLVLLLFWGVSNLDLFQKIKTIWYWIPAIFIANSIYNLYQYYLRAIDKTFIMMISSCVNSIVMLASNVYMLSYLSLGINGYLLSIVLGYSCSSIIMIIGNKLYYNSFTKNWIKKEEITELLKYCIPTIFTALAWWVNSSLDRYFVINMCGDSANGIYSISYKIPNILGILQTIFIQAWTLSAIVEFDKEDKDGFFGRTYDTYNGLMVISCSIIILLNNPLSRMLYSNEFYEARHFVPLLLESSLFSAVNGYIGSIFSAVKDTKASAYTTILSAIINTFLNTILIPQYGIYGAATATLVAYVSAWIMRLFISRKYIHMKIHFAREIVAYFLLTAQMIVSTLSETNYLLQIIIIAVEFIVLYRCFVPNVINKIMHIIRDRSTL